MPLPTTAPDHKARAAGFVAKALRGYRCDECGAITHLSDLNDSMVCGSCCPVTYEAPAFRRALLEG